MSDLTDLLAPQVIIHKAAVLSFFSSTEKHKQSGLNNNYFSCPSTNIFQIYKHRGKMMGVLQVSVSHYCFLFIV